MQDIGTRLCWQVFVDDPGATVGLSELIHFAEAPDFASLKADEVPYPSNIVKKVVAPIPYAPILNYTNNNAAYETEYQEGVTGGVKGGPLEGKWLSHIRGPQDDSDSQTVMGPFRFTFDPPQGDYQLTEIRILGPQGNKTATIRNVVPDYPKNSFEIVMQRIHYGGENVVNLDVEVVYGPLQKAIDVYKEKKRAADAKYDAAKEQLAKKAFQTDVRQRIKDASGIRPRPSWDLREEERTIVYRKLIRRLMLEVESMKLPDTDENRRLRHVRSEIVRAIFDVDAMLYFVAPEWWMPQRRKGQVNLNQNIAGKPYALSNDDVLAWGGEHRDDNYKITEDSSPAKLGSSLGWMMQLDGDNLRNAFLNAPWVKAVMPIRPGRETAALNWLRVIEGHGNDGWNTPYLGTSPEDAEFRGKTIGGVLTIIADRMSNTADIKTVLQSDSVFEHGFNPLAGGFDAGLPANQVFSQWISVVPTEQIVAAAYNPTLTLDI
jgi:hypothetical protein